MKNYLVTICAVVILAGCGTSVPLSDVPVADATPKAVTSGAPIEASNGNVVNGTGVAPVDLGGGSVQPNLPSVPRLVYFDYDSFVIKPEFQTLIAANARLVSSQSGRKVAIEGHTDETGGREYNLALGQKRADAVRNALSILGVAQSQMEAVSFGKEKPVVVGNDEAAYSKNRRVEIRYQ